MSKTEGDVKLNGKWYRIEPALYQMRDLADFLS